MGDRPGAENRQDRRSDFAQNRPDRIADRGDRQDNRQQRRDQVRDQVAENHPRLDFWSDHPGWAAWRINAPWRWATWAAIGGWCGWGSSAPVYNDYGDTVYYQDDGVYAGDQQVATQEEYADQAASLVASGASVDPAKSDWLPLGVFAITQDNQASGATPTLYAQLALNKQGIIAGTLNNQATGETQTLEGAVDQKSQRAAWSVQGRQWPIMETGIANLTQDTSSALVHFADGQTQQWLLVRLEEPKQQK